MLEPQPNDHGHGLWLAQHICADLHIDTGGHGTKIVLHVPIEALAYDSP
jgi:hypothetical protein